MSNLTYIIILSFLNFLIYLNFNFLEKKINIYNNPASRKIHKKKISSIGGLIIFFNFFIWYFLIKTNLIFSQNLVIVDSLLDHLFIIGFCIFITGIIDDKFELSYKYKFLIITFLLLLLLNLEPSFLVKELEFETTGTTINLGKYTFLFTLLSFLLFMNACNMFDGINLQFGVYSLVLSLFLISVIGQNYLLLSIIIGLLFFLLLNFQNKTFIGDSGTLFLSFIYASLIILTYNNKVFEISVEKIFLVMMLPGIDMLRVFLIRITNGKNPFKPDRIHLHHLLMSQYGLNKIFFIIFLIYFIPIFILLFFHINLIYLILIEIIVYIAIVIKHNGFKY